MVMKFFAICVVAFFGYVIFCAVKCIKEAIQNEEKMQACVLIVGTIVCALIIATVVAGAFIM